MMGDKEERTLSEKCVDSQWNMYKQLWNYIISVLLCLLWKDAWGEGDEKGMSQNLTSIDWLNSLCDMIIDQGVPSQWQ